MLHPNVNNYLKRLDEYHMKIGNIHILIESTIETVRSLESLKDVRNQVYHIFDLDPFKVATVIGYIFRYVHPDAKIVIHVPRMIRGYENTIKNFKESHTNLDRIKFYIDPDKGARFKYFDPLLTYPMYINIVFNDCNEIYTIQVYGRLQTFWTPKLNYVGGNDWIRDVVNYTRTIRKEKYNECNSK